MVFGPKNLEIWVLRAFGIEGGNASWERRAWGWGGRGAAQKLLDPTAQIVFGELFMVLLYMLRYITEPRVQCCPEARGSLGCLALFLSTGGRDLGPDHGVSGV